MPHTDCSCVRQSRPARPGIREQWPTRIAIVVIIIIVIPTPHGMGACLALAFAREFHDLWCTSAGVARRRGIGRKR